MNKSELNQFKELYEKLVQEGHKHFNTFYNAHHFRPEVDELEVVGIADDHIEFSFYDDWGDPQETDMPIEYAVSESYRKDYHKKIELSKKLKEQQRQQNEIAQKEIAKKNRHDQYLRLKEEFENESE